MVATTTEGIGNGSVENNPSIRRNFRKIDVMGTTKLQGSEIATTAPTDGQSLIWNNSSKKWTPTDLAGSGTLGINLGGTGGTTDTQARANLIAAKSGANSDITSISNLTTPLTVAQGGTGTNTLTGIIVGNGTSALSTVTAPSGTIVGNSDVQTLTNKTISISTNTLTGVAASGANSDITSITSLTTLRIAAAASSSVEGDTGNDSTQKSFWNFVDGIKQFVPGVIFVSTADKTVTNTLTETSVVGTGIGTTTLPANFFVVGKTLRIKIGGIISSALVAGTINLKIKLGSTIINQTTAATLANSLTSQTWNTEIILTCRTTGASGTVIALGGVGLNTAIGLLTSLGLAPTGVVTIDTTTSQALDFTATWGTQDVANIIKSTHAIIEVIA